MKNKSRRTYKEAAEMEEENDRRLKAQTIEKIKTYTSMYNEKIKELSERKFSPTEEQIKEIYNILTKLSEAYTTADLNILYSDSKKFERKREEVDAQKRKAENLLRRYEKFVEKKTQNGERGTRNGTSEEPEL